MFETCPRCGDDTVTNNDPCLPPHLGNVHCESITCEWEEYEVEI